MGLFLLLLSKSLDGFIAEIYFYMSHNLAFLSVVLPDNK